MNAPANDGMAALYRLVRTATDGGLGYLRRVDPDAADELEHERRHRPQRPVFVIVGETKRGKSSLVNALLGVADLSPVDAAVATAAYLEFEHGATPEARAYTPGADSPVPLELGQLRDWATVLGQLPDGVRPPRRIVVTHPAPLLQRLTLVDTPGTGGLDATHAEIALDAVERATALLFVVDASSPLSRPELRFLVEASQRVNSVIFALTKVDAYPGWRTILADNQALMAAHAPRFAGAAWFPVSARLVELAMTMPEAANALMAEAGVPQLRRALTELAARGDVLAEANTLRAVRAGFVRLDAALADKIRASDPDPAEMERAKAERSALNERRRTESRQWQLSLSAETNRARVDATEQLRTRVAAVQEHVLNLIDSAGGDALKALPAEVDRGLAWLSVQLSRYLEARFQAVGEKVLSEVFDADELRAVTAQLNATLRHQMSAKPRREGSGDGGMVVLSSVGVANLAGQSAVAGLGAASAALGFAGASLMVPVVGVGLGLAAGAFMVWKRRTHADRAQARQWLREVMGETRAALSDEIAHRFTDLQYALNLALDEALAKRVRELEAHIADIDRALAEDKATRTKRRQALQQQRDELRERGKQADDALARAKQAATPAVTAPAPRKA